MPGGIAVFDSGMGGLDVAAALSRTLPNEALIYLGDNARVPYGTKSAEVVRRYTEEAAELLSKHDMKALVIACNTASAVVDIPMLESKLGIPVFGMIQAGVNACKKILSTNKNEYEVLVLATPGTIRSQAYQRALAQSFPQLQCHAIACPIFVPIVEMGWEDHRLAPQMIKAQLLDSNLAQFLWPQTQEEKQLSAYNKKRIYLLGCTHYPMLSRALNSALLELHQDTQVSEDQEKHQEFICLDGAESVALQVKARLQELKLLSEPQFNQAYPKHIAYFTDELKDQIAQQLALRFWQKRAGWGSLNFQCI